MACGGGATTISVALPVAPQAGPGEDDIADAAPPADPGAVATAIRAPHRDPAEAVFKVPVGTSPVRGPASALVTIVEFADYQCPFCQRAEETLRALLSRHPDTVRIVFKDEPLPFHTRAEPAAEAALEVRAEKGDAAFWKMHDRILDSPPDLDGLRDETLVRLATASGARADLVRAAIAGHTHRAEIEADLETAEDFEAGGTPHFFVNGRRVVGAQPEEVFEAMIVEEIERAGKLVASGTRPEAVYDALVAGGQGPPEPPPVDATRLPPRGPARGLATAPVTVHEFADFQCPFCSQSEATLREIAKAYGDNVRFVWHDLPLPFHPNALLAAAGAREARSQRGDRAFWALHDKLLADPSKLSRQDLDADARALGLDMLRWKASLDAGAHSGEIDADRNAAEALGLQGTPSFVVVPTGATRGYAVLGAQGFGRFHKVIDRALAEAVPPVPAAAKVVGSGTR